MSEVGQSINVAAWLEANGEQQRAVVSVSTDGSQRLLIVEMFGPDAMGVPSWHQIALYDVGLNTDHRSDPLLQRVLVQFIESYLGLRRAVR